jgi:hypothetical protein
MTKRDKEFLITLYNNRFMSTEQIAELFYKYDEEGNINKNKEEIARRRLRKMKDKDNLLILEYVPYANESKVYTLAEKGTIMVCSWLNKKFENFTNKNDMLQIGLVEHSLEINEIYIKLLQLCRKHQYEIITFLVERHNRRTMGKLTFQPDIFMILRHKVTKKGRPYYIELDRNTEAPKKFAQKTTAYETFYHSDVFKEDWNNQNLRPDILVLTDNKNRSERLQSTIKSSLKWIFIEKENIEQIFRG